MTPTPKAAEALARIARAMETGEPAKVAGPWVWCQSQPGHWVRYGIDGDAACIVSDLVAAWYSVVESECRAAMRVGDAAILADHWLLLDAADLASIRPEEPPR